MKKILLLAAFFVACKKNPAIDTTPVKVVEDVSNRPVDNAMLVIQRCDFGCPLGPKVLFKGQTDNNGICQVPSESYATTGASMNVTKPKYWEFETQYNTTVTLAPEGWLRLNIHKAGTYPAGTVLVLVVVNQTGTRSELTQYNTASDSVLLIKAFGGQRNKIDWQVQGATLLNNGSLPDLQIPRFDTLKNITLNY
jgi:hypothetical protein